MRRFFTSPSRIALVVVLLALALMAAATGSQAEQLRDVGAPGQSGSAAQPDKVIASGAKPGVYYLDYGSTQLSPTKYPVDGAIRFYQWSTLNPASGTYAWAELDAWIAQRKAAGLETGIMITTYDGSTAGDIRSTPDYVIEKDNAVVPVFIKGTTDPEYLNYWRRTSYNGDFDYSDHQYSWRLAGSSTIISTPPADPDSLAAGYAAQLGGTDGATGSLYHVEERIPAMPTSLSSTTTSYVSARVYVSTSDPNPNDHLYLELWNTSNVKIGSIQLDVNNLSQPNNTWKNYTFNVSSIAHKKSVRVAFRVVNDSTPGTPTTFYVDNVEMRVRHLIPRYHGINWGLATASNPYLDSYKTFIQALGDHLKTNTDMQFIAIGTGVYGENQPTQDQYNYVMEGAGLTATNWTDTINKISEKYASAFTIPGVGPARHLLLQFAPSYKSANEKRDTTDYAAGLKVGLSSNFLMPDYTQAYKNDRTGAYDPIRSYWPSVPIAFESYTLDLCSPVLTYWALINGIEKHADYIRADDKLVRASDGSLTANAPFFDWARQYLGKTTQDTPSVWTVMREHRNPTLYACRGAMYYYLSPDGGSTWPQLGNYNFWLYQVDAIPGGRTVPETNDKGADKRYARDPNTGASWTVAGLGNCPPKQYNEAMYGANYPCNYEPYNADLPALEGQTLSNYRDFYDPTDWTGGGKEAWVVRRTDQNADAAKNNPYMFFMIDDEYIKGDAKDDKAYKAEITVKYFDIGTDKWSLTYDSTGGPKAAVASDGKSYVQKTGTKALKEVTFTVMDGEFAGRLAGGADFYLDSRDPTTKDLDGNEWVHMVEVKKIDTTIPPTNTPTITPTPTQTATPTVTPTATPTTGIVEGIAYHDANSNDARDAGEAGVAGGVMKLKPWVSSGATYTATSLADGTFRFAAVAPGQYTLTEESAPAGYLRNTTFSLTFQVRANEVMGGFEIGHQKQATPTATATATVTRTPTPTATSTPETRYNYLPLLLVASGK